MLHFITNFLNDVWRLNVLATVAVIVAIVVVVVVVFFVFVVIATWSFWYIILMMANTNKMRAKNMSQPLPGEWTSESFFAEVHCVDIE